LFIGGLSIRAKELKYATLYVLSLILEVSSFKPGNVNRFFDLPKNRFEEFIVTAAGVFEGALKVARRSFMVIKNKLDISTINIGKLIYDIIKSYRKICTSCGNTYLGSSILLTAIEASSIISGSTNPKVIGDYVIRILRKSSVNDSIYFYKAIRLAKPGKWIRKYDAYKHVLPDIYDPRFGIKLRKLNLNLYEILKNSAKYDLISAELVSGLKVINNLIYPYFIKAVSKLNDLFLAITQTYLYTLSNVRDTLVIRKGGYELAEYVSKLARRALMLGGVESIEGKELIKDMNVKLLRYGSLTNAGSVADLIAGTIYIYLLNNMEVKPINRDLSNVWLFLKK